MLSRCLCVTPCFRHHLYDGMSRFQTDAHDSFYTSRRHSWGCIQSEIEQGLEELSVQTALRPFAAAILMVRFVSRTNVRVRRRQRYSTSVITDRAHGISSMIRVRGRMHVITGHGT